MSKQQKLNTHLCFLGTLVLAIIYWLSETILHSTVFHGSGLSAWLLPIDNVYEMWMRLFIVTFFVIFGVTMDISLARLRRANQKSARLVDELQKSLSEVKTLSGLLPICSMCKRVKDDDGYWQQVEKYLSDHSDAEFSHGYCPDCDEMFFRETEAIDDIEEKDSQQTDSGDKQ